VYEICDLAHPQQVPVVRGTNPQQEPVVANVKTTPCISGRGEVGLLVRHAPDQFEVGNVIARRIHSENRTAWII
jgi:hypothetical protein